MDGVAPVPMHRGSVTGQCPVSSAGAAAAVASITAAQRGNNGGNGGRVDLGTAESRCVRPFVRPRRSGPSGAVSGSGDGVSIVAASGRAVSAM